MYEWIREKLLSIAKVDVSRHVIQSLCLVTPESRLGFPPLHLDSNSKHYTNVSTAYIQKKFGGQWSKEKKICVIFRVKTKKISTLILLQFGNCHPKMIVKNLFLENTRILGQKPKNWR